MAFFGYGFGPIALGGRINIVRSKNVDSAEYARTSCFFFFYKIRNNSVIYKSAGSASNIVVSTD